MTLHGMFSYEVQDECLEVGHGILRGPKRRDLGGCEKLTMWVAKGGVGIKVRV